MSESRGKPLRSRSSKGRMLEKRADIARSSHFMPAKTVDCCQRPPSTLMDAAAVSFVARSVSSSRASHCGACEVITILPPNTYPKSSTLDERNEVMHAFAMRSMKRLTRSSEKLHCSAQRATGAQSHELASYR